MPSLHRRLRSSLCLSGLADCHPRPQLLPPSRLPKDLPPLSYEGIGSGADDAVSTQPKSIVQTTEAGDAGGPIRALADQLPNTGTSRVLCVCLYPWDVVPADPATARQAIVEDCECRGTGGGGVECGLLSVQGGCPGAGSWAGLIRRVLVMGEVENIGLCVTHSLQIDTNVIFESVCSPLQFSPLPIIFAG